MNAISDAAHIEEGLRLYQAEQLFVDAAQAQAKVDDLKERLKRRLAALTIHHIDSGKSAAAAEKYALASKTYGDLSDEWIAANYEAEAMKAKVKSHDNQTDIWRSINAVKRAEMGLR